MASPLNLSVLGVELDGVRRARRRDEAPPAPSAETDSEADTSEAADTTESPPTSPDVAPRALPPRAAPEDTPLPLCLLCFARTPSAVLLPCAHLNLCYLCAPLLMHKKAKAECFREVAEVDGAPNPRPGFAAALSRAVGSSPKARRLSMGGYVPPREGVRGGEMRGRDLLPLREGACGVGATGLAASAGADGRVELALQGEGAGAQCLVCRAEVSGWLRVYTG